MLVTDLEIKELRAALKVNPYEFHDWMDADLLARILDELVYLRQLVPPDELCKAGLPEVA